MTMDSSRTEEQQCRSFQDCNSCVPYFYTVELPMCLVSTSAAHKARIGTMVPDTGLPRVTRRNVSIEGAAHGEVYCHS
jgi:hypothetical protein